MDTYIGIDVSKQTLDVYYPGKKVKTFNNNFKGYEQILTLCQSSDKTSFIWVFEPTGGYEKSLQKFCQQSLISFVMVHPNKVRSFAKAKGLYAKTDSLDAQLLSEYAVAFQLQSQDVQLPPDLQDIQALRNRRQQLIECKNQEICRLDVQTSLILKSSLQGHIEWLAR